MSDFSKGQATRGEHLCPHIHRPKLGWEAEATWLELSTHQIWRCSAPKHKIQRRGTTIIKAESLNRWKLSTTSSSTPEGAAVTQGYWAARRQKDQKGRRRRSRCWKTYKDGTPRHTRITSSSSSITNKREQHQNKTARPRGSQETKL